jgi:hypothetical protein
MINRDDRGLPRDAGSGLFWIEPFVERDTVTSWIDQRTITTSFAAEQSGPPRRSDVHNRESRPASDVDPVHARRPGRGPHQRRLVALGELSGSRMSKWVAITVIVVVVLSRISALCDFWRRR